MKIAFGNRTYDMRKVTCRADEVKRNDILIIDSDLFRVSTHAMYDQMHVKLTTKDADKRESVRILKRYQFVSVYRRNY